MEPAALNLSRNNPAVITSSPSYQATPSGGELNLAEQWTSFLLTALPSAGGTRDTDLPSCEVPRCSLKSLAEEING